MRKFLIISFIVLIAGCAVGPPKEQVEGPPLVKTLSLEEKVGQMFMIRYSGSFYQENSYTYRWMKRLIEERKIGGVIQFVGSIHGTVENLNELQRISDLPLLIAADYERGVGQLLDGGTLFPTNMAVAATNSPGLAYKQGRITAQEGRAVGVHVTFAPVMDVNSNPDNPIINFRAYGDTPEIVERFGRAFIRGVQENNMVATAKHFPGHGNTATDSHTSLPVITAERGDFERVDLAPFKAAVESGVGMIMVGHIAVPSISNNDLPATMTSELSGDLLRKELGFDGIIVTDALEMGGITDSHWAGEAAIRAIEAGTDIVLLPLDVDRAMESVLEAVKSGRLPEWRIDESVQRIFKMKEEMGLWEKREVSFKEAQTVVGNSEHISAASEIARKSITLVSDKLNAIPFRAEEADTLTHIILSTDDGLRSMSSTFDRSVSRIHGNIKSQFIHEPVDDYDIQRILKEAATSDYIICSLFIRVRMNKGQVSIDPSHRELIARLQETGIPVVVASFGSPYVPDVDNLDAYLCAYGYSSISQKAMADAIFGAVSIGGKLPVQLSADISVGHGLKRSPRKMLPISNEYDFSAVAVVIEQAISDSVFPGAQIAVVKEGEMVWTFESGRQTYDEDSPSVTGETIYDVASLTKVTSTTPVAMKLVEQKKLPLDEPIIEFIPEFAGGDKDKITIRHLLTHSAGLQGYDEFPLGTTGGEIVASIIERPLVAVPGDTFIYSDFGPILLGNIMEKVSGRALEDLAESTVFRPLGMTNTMFNPDSTVLSRIAPTEIDERYQRGLVHGIVHDERAWQLGGVAGHAGLFSTATDLVHYAQMMINRGFYGGRRYFKRSTIENFTTRQEMSPGSERALGWDTPSEEGSLAGDFFSPGSYGHTGFTGTSMWIDPKRKIAVILLTNHVYPSRGKTAEEFKMWKAEMREVRRAFQNGVMQILLQDN